MHFRQDQFHTTLGTKLDLDKNFLIRVKKNYPSCQLYICNAPYKYPRPSKLNWSSDTPYQLSMFIDNWSGPTTLTRDFKVNNGNRKGISGV